MGTVVVAEENYGEGSSREHAAMEPRFLNVKSFWSNLLPYSRNESKETRHAGFDFADKDDYDKIREDGQHHGLESLPPGKLDNHVKHADCSIDEFEAVFYNEQQITGSKPEVH